MCSARAAGSDCACCRMACMTGSCMIPIIWDMVSMSVSNSNVMAETYLGVPQQPLPRLFLGFVFASGIHGVKCLLLLLLNLFGVGTLVVLGIHGLRLGASIHTLAVLAHSVVGLGLANVGADEL